MSLKRFKAKTGGVVTAAAESKSRLNVKDGSALRIVVIVPYRSDKQFFSDGHRLEVFLPVVLPVLISANAEVDIVLYALCVIAFGEERNRLGRVFFGRNVDVNSRLVPVLFEQIFVNEVDVSDLPCRLFKVAVILDIYSVGNDHLSNVACRFHVL